MDIQIKRFQNKNKTRNEKDINKFHTIDQQKYTKFQHHIFNNNTKVNTNPQHFTNTKIEELNDFENSSDYEAMWEKLSSYNRRRNRNRTRSKTFLGEKHIEILKNTAPCTETITEFEKLKKTN